MCKIDYVSKNNVFKVKTAADGMERWQLQTHYATFNMPESEEEREQYREYARKVLNRLSKDYNSEGIQSVLGALLYEVHVSEYYGKHNS